MDNRNKHKHHHSNKNSEYENQMKNFVGKEIEVTDSNNEVFKGKCLAISHPYLNVVLEVDEGLVVIRNIANLKLVR